ncbi:MAG: phage holin family protein [bacterium]|nr:phage holin family protein [bacterium]
MNAIIILLVAAVIPGFRVRGFGWALLFSLVLSVIHALLYSLVT